MNSSEVATHLQRVDLWYFSRATAAVPIRLCSASHLLQGGIALRLYGIGVAGLGHLVVQEQLHKRLHALCLLNEVERDIPSPQLDLDRGRRVWAHLFNPC